MPGIDGRDHDSRGDIPAGIANLGVIIGGPAFRPAANDNRARPEPESIGTPGDRDGEEAAPD